MATKEDYRSIPGFPGYFISKSGTVINLGSTRKQQKPLKPTYYGNQARVTAFDTEGKRKSLFIPMTLLEVFGSPRPNKNYGVEFKDGDCTNLNFDNLYWKQYDRGKGRSVKGVKVDENGYRYLGKRSCSLCRKYPCMERQANGSTTFDFGAYGCIDYKEN